MKSNKQILLLTIAIWILAMSSLLGVHFLLRKRPFPLKRPPEFRALLDSVDDDLKTGLRRYDNGLLRVNNGKLQFLGMGFENAEEELLNNGTIIKREIIFQPEDPIALERSAYVDEAFKTLNNTEKICFLEGFATFIYRDGRYSLVIDSAIYNEYLPKYGVECETCEEIKKKRG